MFSYMSRLRAGKKGQIFPVLIVIIVILIIAALISVNLSKVSGDRLSCITGADAGAIAGVSAYSRGYNKASYAHPIMLGVFIALQIYLIIPECWYCWFIRQAIAMVGINFNENLYEWAKAMVKGYSSAVRKDAYSFAFSNAGIDDSARWDPALNAYRDKPYATEAWADWIKLEPAFSKWINDTCANEGWENACSITYNWEEARWKNKKSVTFYGGSCNSSSPQDLGANTWLLLGLYLLDIEAPCWFPMLIPHPPLIKISLKNPSRRWVRMRVVRSYAASEQEQNLGFWSVRRPDTEATAEVKMSGSFGWFNPFDLDLTR